MPPPAATLLVLGNRQLLPALHRSVAGAALAGEHPLVVDCGGEFDVHLLYHEARRMQPCPDEVLDRVWVVRAFTAYQELHALQLVWRRPRWRRLYVLNPLELLADPDLPAGDSEWLFGRLRRAFAVLPEAGCALRAWLPPEPATDRWARALTRVFPAWDWAANRYLDAAHGQERLAVLPSARPAGIPVRPLPPRPDTRGSGALRPAV